MRRMLFAIAALLACGSAWAEGPIVRWSRIEGVLPPPDSPMVIGDQGNKIRSHTQFVTAGNGRAMVNLETGFVSFQVEGLAFSNTMTSSPIGSMGDISVMGTVVCNAGMRDSPWVIEFADTEKTYLRSGAGSFSGFVAIPPMCLENPGQIAFLIRRPLDALILPGSFIAYGAGRTVQ